MLTASPAFIQLLQGGVVRDPLVLVAAECPGPDGKHSSFRSRSPMRSYRLQGRAGGQTVRPSQSPRGGQPALPLDVPPIRRVVRARAHGKQARDQHSALRPGGHRRSLRGRTGTFAVMIG